MLDLFSGSGSVAKRLTELGYDVITLDVNPRCNPKIVADILRWPYRKYFSVGHFDIITASPPCEAYSQARTTKPRNFELADKIVKRTLEIIHYFQPRMWWIENPRNGYLRHRPFMQKLPYLDVDYCQFSEWGYKKPTRIWGSKQLIELPNVVCQPKLCPLTKDGPHGKRVHIEQLGGNRMRFSTAQKAIFPERLVDYLLQEGLYAGATWDCSQDFIHERYQVRPPVVQDILAKLGDPKPVVDMFADENLHLFPKWWGPGSAVPDAFQISWEGEGLMWCNPPFSKLQQIVDKIRHDRARCVLIMPNWPTQPWFQSAQELAVKKVFYHPGSEIFDVDRGKVGGVRWGVWAMLLDGTRTKTAVQAGTGVRHSNTAGSPSEIRAYWRHPSRSFHVSSLRFRNNELQLVMLISVCLADNTERKLKVLIDTGAQANLIRIGLAPENMLSVSNDPLCLRMANGQRLEGGRRVVSTCLGFRQVVRGEILPSLFQRPCEFYEADIMVDAIISFPWLVSHNIGVFPHLKALAILEPQFSLLLGVTPKTRVVQYFSRREEEDPLDHSIPYEGGGWSGFNRPSSRTHRRRWANVHHVVANPQQQDREQLQFQLEKLRLHVPPVEHHATLDFLTEREVGIVARHLETADSGHGINTLVVSDDAATLPQGWEPAQLDKFRAKLHEDFDGTALRSEVFPDPPVRGPYGYAHIPLEPNAIPTRAKPFQMYGERNEALKKITQEWVERKFIERPPKGGSEWLSPAFAVSKKSASFPWRGVVDMRGPNSQTRRCSYPLPCIEDILVRQGAKQIFSILDLRQAFHQQPLHPDSRHVTSTHTPLGVFQWRVNIMGLKNAGIQFQMMIDDRLQPVRDVADAYVDDIIIGTRVKAGEDLFAAHDRDVRRVLSLLVKEKLVADISKCRFFVPEVEFCGHILRNGTRSPAPGKLSAIEKWERPRTISELRAFLGFTNYYHSYVKDYANVVAKLQDKLKVPREIGKKGSRAKIEWDVEDERLFEEVKRKLCSNLVLQRVNPDKPFILRTDASRYAVGATLEQLLDEDRQPTIDDVRQGKTVPVAFMSRKLTATQRNWVPREQETYAIILALQKWESWIGLQKVLVLSDHKALESWAREVLDTPSGPLGRRSRWHQILSKYDLSVGYIPGPENTVADILSRWAYPASQVMRDISIHGSEQEDDEMSRIIDEEKKDARGCIYVVLNGPPGENPPRASRATSKRRGGGHPVTPPQPLRFSFKAPGVASAPPEPRRPFSFIQPQGVGSPARTKPEDDGSFPGTPVFNNPSSSSDSVGEPEQFSPEFGLADEPLAEGEGEVSAAPPMLPPQDQAASSSSSSHVVPDSVVPKAEPEAELDPPLTVAEMLLCNWETEYGKCPTFGLPWKLTHGTAEGWPLGYSLHRSRLFWEGKTCIPWTLQNATVRQFHEFMLHVGPQRLWDKLSLIYHFAVPEKAKEFTWEVGNQCETCQACQRPSAKEGPLAFTPIPPRIMESVAIDVFYVGPTTFEDQRFDSMVVCVDRHSGWLVALPCLDKGLTGEWVAKSMLKYWWRPFGIPSVISSDRGSHFVNNWWDTMCAKLGIRQMFSPAYHHQANGRVEVCGQQLLERLRKLNARESVNWVEVLPMVVDRYHDTPGESGLTPYQIVFGRERSFGNLPYEMSNENEDARTFFERMRTIDQRVADVLNRRHTLRARSINKGKPQHPMFNVGELVWYRRPEKSGTKLDSRWLGPCKITKKVAEHTYEIQVGEHRWMRAHNTFLKPHVVDSAWGAPVSRYFHQRTKMNRKWVPKEGE